MMNLFSHSPLQRQSIGAIHWHKIEKKLGPAVLEGALRFHQLCVATTLILRQLIKTIHTLFSFCLKKLVKTFILHLPLTRHKR